MKLIGKYTLGTNVTFTWTVLTNGEAVSLEGRDLSVICTDVFHRTIPISYVVVGNDVTVSVLGEDQISYGLLVFQLLETVDEVQRIVDVRGIELVPVAHVGEDGQVVDTEINEGITAAEISFLREIETNEALRIQAEADRVTAEISRVQAEQTRVAADEERASRQVMYDDAEHVRVQNENLRKAAERARQDAEEQRETAELIRQQSEDERDQSETARASAESARSSAEGLRTSAEGIRATAENRRVSAESSRATAESARVTAEQARAAAENNRASAESSRASAESNRATAESARVAAESARVLAEQQREVVKAEMEQMMEDATMGEPNVQADWNETDTTDDAYIRNKPTIYTKAEVDEAIADIDVSEQLNDVAFLGDIEGSATADFDPVADTLHKGAQVLSASEQAQVRANINAQEKLVSGQNMATVNGSDLTHGGNVTIVAAEGQTITIDAAPTPGSNNAVSSGGVYPIQKDMYGAIEQTETTQTITKLGTSSGIRILASTGAADTKSTFSIDVFTIVPGAAYSIHIPLSGSSGVVSIAYSDLNYVGTKSSYSSAHVFPIAVGNDAEQTLSINSASNYATLLVTYINANGAPTVTETQSSTVAYPAIVVKTTDEEYNITTSTAAACGAAKDDLLVITNPITKTTADLTLDGYYNNADTGRTSGYNYKSMPLIEVEGGTTISFHNWKTGDLASSPICWVYDAEGNPVGPNSENGARVRYSDTIDPDYVNGEYMYIVTSACRKLGISLSPTYPSDAYVVIGEKSYTLTEIGKEMIKPVVEYDGNDASSYYLKGNSNIVFPSLKKLGIIAAGQSNIAGRNSYSDLPSGFVNPNNKVQFCNNTNGIFTPFEVVDGGEGNDWGFDAIVYDSLTNPNYGNQSEIYVMKTARGGTSIDRYGATDYHWTADYEFLPSETYSLLRTFEKNIRKGVETEGSNFEIKAFIWHQGEGDSHTKAVAERYYDNLKNMLAYVRGVVGNPRLHFFCGTISNNNTADPFTGIVNAAYEKLATQDPYLHLIDMSNAQLEDSWHFNYQWSIYFGQKVYDAMIDAGIISGTKINPTEPS